MANNWYGNLFGNNTPSDPSTFDYITAELKVQRQRAAAQALQALGMQGNQGQFIKSGDFTGYAGGHTLGSTAGRVLAAFLGGAANENADSAQKQLGLDSQYALSWALDPNNSPAGQRAAAEQTQREADMERQREFARSNNTVHGGDYVDTQSQDTPATIETSAVPVPSASDFKTSPLAIPNAKAVAKALSGQQVGAPTASGKAMPVTGGPDSFGTSADFSKGLAPKTNLPVNAKGPLSADDIAFAAKMLGGATPDSAPRQPQSVPKLQRSDVTASLLPAVVAPNGDAPNAPVRQMPAAPSLEDRARAVGIDPTATRGPGDPSLESQVQQVEAINRQMANGNEPQSDSRTLVEQARDAANSNASMADKMAVLAQIARTGPQGQAIAQGMQQQMFSHSDRYEVKLNDNGDAIRLDKWTGAVEPVRGVANTLKVDQADIDRRKLVDPSNAQSVAEYNAWRQQRGMAPLAPQTIEGSNVSADARHAANKADADSVSTIVQRRTEAASQVADLGKINRDLQAGMVLANQAAGRWNGAAASISQLWGGESAQARQILNRIINDSTLMSIMQDKGGSGSAGIGLMKAYQDHGMDASMTPQALQQGLQQIQQAIQERLAAKQAEVGAHDFALGKLGYQPQAQSHQQAGNSGASNGRAPGNYSF